MKKRKPTNNQIKRRSFLKKGVAASSIFIIPRHVLGGQDIVYRCSCIMMCVDMLRNLRILLGPRSI